MASPVYSSNSNSSNNTDCISCRLVSFVGLTGSGAYVAYHARKQQGHFGKAVLTAFALGLGYMGVARLINIYPFGRHRSSPNKT